MEELMKEINEFRDERNWRPFHTHKDLAISVCLEASELLENFQWKNDQQAVEADMENIKDEIADVYIYLMMLADDLDLDIKEIVRNKIVKNGIKYPVEKTHNLEVKPANK